ncbi:MAG: hypothetical protein H7Y33_02125 [Cytophagales bacterium]|nr:hypothetical protein [Rhizobacter sp.]
MNSLRGLLAMAICALAGLPAWGAIEVAESVDYLQGAQPAEAGCTWEASMVSTVATRSKGAITPVGKTPSASGLRLSLQVVRLDLARTAKESEYSVVVRGNVTQDGKLLATRDFQDDKSFKNGQPACDALRTLGASLGESAADWAAQTRFMECGEGCAGIHPDETIVVGAEVVIDNTEAINDTVRNDCRWPTAMVSRLIKAFNESDDPPPRAKLESRPIDIEKYSGRRLVLRLNEVHALGGGGYTGPKWMTMSGELREGKALIANFESHSQSGRGLTTCRSVDSLSDSTTEMIVKWLRSPTLGAKLK